VDAGIGGVYSVSMPDDRRLTIADVFALPLNDPDETRVQLLDRACDRHYWLYMDNAGNEVRLAADAPWPEEAEAPIPIWTKDHIDQVVEWTTSDPAEFGFVGTDWVQEGDGWVRARVREPGE
jgi:hypothetical protein